eukprot:CAMPEP_0198697658 /NCGR_PEP_ID=MMETSP1468-20131203/325680_1 /TAXON_ID=1461545 /ORGANISM="Mantoniella sp, Strain CCMP1436" /LENGTH=145 /DNA_ID=CAMNT_0044454395 /DNA_START=155 /DNA_END=593 /DNA_ORIENTATION=-
MLLQPLLLRGCGCRRREDAGGTHAPAWLPARRIPPIVVLLHERSTQRAPLGRPAAVGGSAACCLSVTPLASAASITTAAACSYLSSRARSDSASARSVETSPALRSASPPPPPLEEDSASCEVSAMVSASARHTDASASTDPGTT